MRRVLLICAAVSISLALLCGILYYILPFKVLLTLAISAGTTAYHFWMRLTVGTAIHALKHNRFNYRRRWFRPFPFEASLYCRLHVRQWKDKLPTYDPDIFSTQTHSWDEIAQAMCQAEIVHEVIILLSFLPLFAARWFGAFGVFLITSLLAAGYDLLFVILQRYNRPRVIRVALHQCASAKEKS